MSSENITPHIRTERITEALAVGLNLAYTALYILEIKWCFILAFVGSLLFVWLCFRKNILAEVVLQGFYVFMAVYGWNHWGSSFEVTRWEFQTHVMLIGTGIVVWLASAMWLRTFSNSKLPFIDTFTTIFSILATWLMVNMEPTNWWYWIVIDSISIYLYCKRGLKFGAAMFVVYLVLAIVGPISSFG